MANKKDATLEQAASAFNDLAVKGTAPLTYDEAFEMLDKTDDKLLESLATEYFTFDKIGQTESFVVEGLDVTSMQGKQVSIVKLRKKDGSSCVNADKVLVSSCERLKTLPAYIRVKYVGDKKSSVGEYKDLSVKTFPVPTS